RASAATGLLWKPSLSARSLYLCGDRAAACWRAWLSLLRRAATHCGSGARLTFEHVCKVFNGRLDSFYHLSFRLRVPRSRRPLRCGVSFPTKWLRGCLFQLVSSCDFRPKTCSNVPAWKADDRIKPKAVRTGSQTAYGYRGWERASRGVFPVQRLNAFV